MAKSKPVRSRNPPRRPAPPRRVRRSVMAGVAIVAPPLLTLAILVWIGLTIKRSVIAPVETFTRQVVVWVIRDVQPSVSGSAVAGTPGVIQSPGGRYVRLADGYWVPDEVVQAVERRFGPPLPPTARGVYLAYVEARYLPDELLVPVLIAAFVVVMYLVGKAFAVGLGRALWRLVERLVFHVPVVSNVYSSVKQVTDFMLDDARSEARRVVAIEYPCEGVWTLALVTGEGMCGLRTLEGEELVTVMLPPSPFPAPGYTAVVRKRDVYPTTLSVEECLKFVMSCGVVCPRRAADDAATPKLR